MKKNPSKEKKCVAINLYALLFFLLVSVNLNGQSDTVKTEHGYFLINHTRLEGPKIRPGESIVVHVKTWVGDSLLASTYQSDGPRTIILPRPEELGSRVPAIFDAAMLMCAGDSALVLQLIDSSMVQYLPENLKNETLIRFEIKIEQVITKEDQEKKAREAMEKLSTVEADMALILKQYKQGKLSKKITKTPSGLKILVLDIGAGPVLQVGKNVSMHYYGLTRKGKMFDNSFRRGEPIEFPPGTNRMIPGIEEGVLLLHSGGKAVLFLPPNLAYGAEGSSDGTIKPNSELIFYVEVL